MEDGRGLVSRHWIFLPKKRSDSLFIQQSLAFRALFKQAKMPDVNAQRGVPRDQVNERSLQRRQRTIAAMILAPNQSRSDGHLHHVRGWFRRERFPLARQRRRRLGPCVSRRRVRRTWLGHSRGLRLVFRRMNVPTRV